MNIHLVVVQAFGSHAKGDRITDPSEIATVLASDHSGNVVRLQLDDVVGVHPEQEV